MTRPRALALLSSGLDSAAATYLSRQTHDLALALTFDYGQRAAKSEIRQASRLAEYFSVPHRVITLEWFRDFESALVDETRALPRPSVRDLDDATFSASSAKAVWVPNRNGVMLEIAAGIAENMGVDSVVVGFNREEAATFPDNSVAYLTALNEALKFSTNEKVSVISPTMSLDKKEIVARIRDEFPFSLLWSCYQTNEVMCGECESCRRLKRALLANEVEVAELFQNAR